MLIILLILAIIIGATIIILSEDIGKAVGGLIIIVTTIALISNIAIIVDGRTSDEKITMYQEENNKIQDEVTTIVEGYKDFEKETYSDLKTQSVTTLVSLFPELKSNELVNRQIDIYIENNNKIKELKENKINITTSKWWVYFGK